jgi:hypothetical protein
MKKNDLPAVACKNVGFQAVLVSVMLMLCLCSRSGYARKAAPAATPVAETAQPQFTYKIIEGANGSLG